MTILRIGVFFAVLSASAFGQVTTYHYDTARTGAVLNETILTTSNVNVNTFGKLFSLAVDGNIYGQPLYVPSVSIPQNGIHNVVYVTTQNNSVYAFDADSAGSPLWHVNLGPPMPQGVCCQPKDIQPQIGITSTPVIDPNAGLLYVVAESYENQVTFFRLHALDITTGIDRLTPAVINGTVPGNSSDSQTGVLAFAPFWHWQRTGLLLANGNIYIGFGSHGDLLPYHGWLFAYSAQTLQQTGILCFAPNTSGSGLWQGGVGLAADAGGYVYLETGNGLLDADTGGEDYGDSVVKVSTYSGPSSGLSVLDYFSPSTQALDAQDDWDLGSSGPLLIPGTSLGVAGGKDGKLYVFNTNNLGGFDMGPLGSDSLVQEWQATFSTSYVPVKAGGFWGGNYIFYNSALFAYGEQDVLKAFLFNGSQFDTVPVSQGDVTVPSGLSNDPAMSISANGFVADTGIVWAAFSSTGIADGTPQPGEFHAFDAANVSRELWNSTQNSSRDSSGSYGKWSPPVVENGKVYLGSFDNALNVYGLIPTGRTISPAAGTPQSATVNGAFSTALQVTVRDANNNALSGVTVTFTAPATGASATFGGAITAPAVTNANGVATAPGLIANGQEGAYTVSATATGAGPAASFYLKNLGGIAASISSIAGTSQSAAVNNVFAAPLQAMVKDAGNNLLGGVTVTFTAPTAGASGAFSGAATVTAVTNASGIATAPALTANSQTGSYTVAATTTGAGAPAGFNLTNTTGRGVLTGAGTSAATTVNLTAEGGTDWIHWGTTPLTRKNGVTPQISTYSLIGTGTVQTYNNDPRALSWTDGTPAAAGSDSNGVYVNSLQNGFSFTAPADTTTRALTVHTGGYSGGGTLTAHLSDGSAPDFVDITSSVNGAYDRNYMLTYKAASAGQTLSVSWVNTSGTGYVSLNGAALLVSRPSISTTAGTPQSATINTIFSTALQAILKDANNNPLSGLAVTFTTPTAGASGAFLGSATATVVTNASGIATAPALTANSQTGSYTVTTMAAGVATPTSFSLSNIPVNITSAAGTPQSTPVNSIFTVTLQAALKDANNDPLSGLTVTFTAPTAGASGAFLGSATATAVTNASGIATAPALTANSQTGSYTVAATTTGAGAPAGFNLTNTTGGGVLTGAGTSAVTTVNLTAEGGTDWIHWGTTPLTRKNGVTPQISTYSLIGTGTVQTYNNDPRALSWTDGTPAAAGSDSNGVYVNSLQNGFSFTAPADTTTRALTVHAGGYSGGGTLTAHLSDGSAPDFVDITSSVNGAYDRNYMLTYKAASAGQTLSVSWVNTSGTGNVTLNGASLLVSGPSISATAGTSQSANVNTAFSTALQATVTNASNPVIGVTVTFTAPTAGASGAFLGSATATAVTNASGIATAPALTANSQTGSYTVAATTTGAGAPAGFNLTNTTGGGVLTGAGTSAVTTVNLTAEGGTDWIHWGTTPLTRKNGVTPQISTYSLIGTGTVQTYNNDPRALSWTDGTPAAAGSDSNGVYVNSLQNGFSFTAPADTTTRALTVHAGGYSGGGTLTAHLSDGSAPDFVDITSSVNGAYDRNYMLTYKAASAGQTLSVSWVNTSGTGNVTLNGASLLVSGPSISATAGTSQSANVNTAFSTALQATVTNASNPVIGVTVTFTAPTAGASGAFLGSATATAVTNASGIATAPALTANSQTGSYTVAATTTGAGAPAGFNLTNTTGGGVLTGAGTSAVTTVNLTAEGGTDWIHWGTTPLTRKNGVTPQISTYSLIGTGTVQTYNNDPRALSWTDGTPAAAGSDSNGVYVNSLQNGFSFTAPADTTTRALTVHAGGYSGGGTLTAHLSDGSAPDFVDITSSVNGAYDRNYMLTYKAASAGQTLSVSWVNTSGTGNVTLNGASLLVSGPSISATAGTSQSANVNTAFSTALQATVTNASNPVIGVTVTFTAPTAGASGAFLGSATATAVTNASGIATAPALTANSQTGSYTVAATTTGAGAPAGFNLTNTTGGGVLTGAGTSAVTTVNLTAEGGTDWIHWGTTPLTRKNGVTPQISTYSLIGTGTVQTYNNDPRALSWTDGTPAAAGSDSNGVYVNSLQNGFSFTAPADTTTRALTVHAGGYSGGGTLTAHLSDGSAPDFVDITSSVNGAYDRNYMLTYKAASAGQTLSVSWVNTSGTGNVTLNGASLLVSGPSISATAGTSQSANVNTAFSTALQATVTNASNPVIGVTVTFTAPTAGASGAFLGSATATAVTNASGIATAPALTANSQTGSYTVAATTTGAGAPAGFNLTNTTGGGVLTGAGTSAVTTVNLTAEGGTDWIHWGTTPLTRKNGVTPQISTYSLIGTGTVQTYNNDPRALSWTDGTPAAAGSDSNGVYVNSLQNGFSFTAPADTTTRALTVHAGGYSGGGTLTAHLSDGSAPDFVDITSSVNGAYDRNYMLTYKAASAGQTLSVSWVNTSGTGNVTLNGAAF